jgi:hypothetical protein
MSALHDVSRLSLVIVVFLAVATPVKGPSAAPVPPTTDKKGPLDDTRGSNYLASKVVEYRYP